MESIARVSTSVSLLPELKPAVDAFVKGGGNFSGLVNSLLKVYFSKGRDPIAVDVVVSDVQNQLSTLQQGMQQLQSKVDSLNALKAQAAHEENKKLAGLETLIREMFDDRGEYENIRYWIRELGGRDAFSRGMRNRCTLVATKAGVSEQVAKTAIINEFPELEEYL